MNPSPIIKKSINECKPSINECKPSINECKPSINECKPSIKEQMIFLLNCVIGRNKYRETSLESVLGISKFTNENIKLEKLNYLFKNLKEKFNLSNINIRWLSRDYLCLEFDYILYFFEISNIGKKHVSFTEEGQRFYDDPIGFIC